MLSPDTEAKAADTNIENVRTDLLGGDDIH